VSDEIATEWDIWKNTLKDIETLRIPRTYVPYLSKTRTRELHAFSTPQKNLLPPWLIYKPPTQSALSNLGFVLGKAKLAPPSEHSIPRLELCAVVLAVEAAQFALEQLDL
jgi:hypothetical protein